MTVVSPRVLLGLLALVPVIALQIRAFVRGRNEIVLLATHWPREQVTRLFAVKWFFSSLAFDAFVLLSILAAANFTWGEQPVEEDRAGLDVVVAVDVSRSMLAEDVSPSRLARSLAVVRSVSRQLSAARMALVAFKGDAITLMPLTEDTNALEIVLDGVRPSLISAPGTNVERGLEEALRSVPEASFAHRAVVLISDGEALSGDTEGPVAELRSRGIPVMAVLAGTPEGATVPGRDGTALLDEDGRPVMTRANAAMLAQIAARSDGALLRLDETDIVADLASRLNEFSRVRETEGFRLVPVRRYRVFLAAALVALFVSIGVRTARWRGMF
ncbi:MAG: vWA domain-containing protein [Spirochaetota bacterium]